MSVEKSEHNAIFYYGNYCIKLIEELSKKLAESINKISWYYYSYLF